MDAASLLARYAAGERDFSGAELQGAELQGAELQGAELQGAELRRADLRGADLRAAHLRGADLRDARLAGVDLYAADLRDADLRGIDARPATGDGEAEAHFEAADLRHARLAGARFASADLRGADLRGAELDDAVFGRADLRGVRLDPESIDHPALRPTLLPAHDDWALTQGAPWPLGVTLVEDGDAYNFALHSVHATAATLLLYAAGDPRVPLARFALDPLVNKTVRVWHLRVPRQAVPDARYYAWSVEGPDATTAPGGRFDPDKVLLDPYARAVCFPPDFSRSACAGPGPTAGRAPLGELPRPRARFDWGSDRRPVHTSDLVIYEMHVRGFTRHESSGVPAERRGTYAGVVDKIPHLVELGVTAVELLPIHQYVAEKGGNYWGYMPLAVFAPHRAYGRAAEADDIADELRGMIKALHAAGIEVILDVVYNHTAETGANGPVFGLKGIDNSTYYLLQSDLRSYRNDTGTGNVLRTSHPAVRHLVLDSLRYWVTEFHVDGFRFDLASIFTRGDDGAINLTDPPIIAEISADPTFEGVRLIAEAWDLGSYQLGRGFPGRSWMQWNGRYRDDVRSFLRGEPGFVPALMTRLYGSSDLFSDAIGEARRPPQSVNFVDCHDGFCLYDLLAYDHKHNEANGNDNADGADDNRSWNCGFEGDDGAPAEVLALRRRQAKNFCCLLLLSAGTPMFCAGDEFLHTQGGNNNPYNQDNETTWLDWTRLLTHRDVFRFFQRAIQLRKAQPVLGSNRFWRDVVRWYGVGREVDLGHDSHTLAFCLHAAPHDLYVMINAYWQDLRFGVHEGGAGEWRQLIDTALPSPRDIPDPGDEPVVPGLDYLLRARSVVVLRRN